MQKIIDTRKRSSFLFFLCGFLSIIPFFLEVTNNGISLPISSYRKVGFPIHSSIILLFISLLFFRFSLSKLIFIIFISVYFIISILFDGMPRAIHAIQSIYFILIFWCLESLSIKNIRSIVKGVVWGLVFFSLLHFLYILINITNAYDYASKIYGLVIYQSHLTYPIVLILGLAIFRNQTINNKFFYFLVFIAIAVVEIILLRRVAISIFLIYIFIFHIKININFLLASLFSIFIVLSFIIGFFEIDLGRLLEARFTRSMTWERSFNYLLEPNIFLFGNGINNTSHNYYMHTITTHGIFYSLIIFYITFNTIFKSFNNNDSYKTIIFILSIILLDWTLNTNIYHPYYATILAIFLISHKKNISIKVAT